MKVIHFIPALDRSLGGVSLYAQLLAKELGKQLELIVVSRPTANPLQLENAKVIYLDRDLKDILKFKRKWVRLLQKEQPDIVHINGIWQIHNWVIQNESLKLGIKTYITPHGMLEPWILNRHPFKKKVSLLLYQKKALMNAIALISTADSETENLTKLKFNNNIITIPNGIDVSSIECKTTWTKTKTLLFVSRIHPKKGIELLVDAVCAIKNKLDGYKIQIAGEGDAEYVLHLKEKIHQLNCDILFEFVGGVYGDMKWQLFRQADFFILPTYSENFGYVIAEALASGTPVITTKGAPWEDIMIYNCGYWIDIDKEALKIAILKAISLKEPELKVKGLNGCHLIENKYSSKKMVDELVIVYKSQ